MNSVTRRRTTAAAREASAPARPTTARATAGTAPAAAGTGPAADVTRVADAVLETVPRVMRRIRRAMRTHEGREPGTTIPQLRALLFVRRKPGCSLSTLAEHLGMTPPGCSGLVERLVRAGWLDRTIDPDERRRVQLRLTADGMEKVAHANLRARAWLVQGLDDVSHHDLSALRTSLALLERVTSAAERG